MLILLAIAITVYIFYNTQRKIYEKKSLSQIGYSVSFSCSEAFSGDIIYMYEEISNDKSLPIVFAKVDTELPEGLSFLTFPSSKSSSSVNGGMQSFIESVFSLRAHSVVRRRWRIFCAKRGIYKPGTVLIITGDMTGSSNSSRRYEVPQSARNTLTVLPRVVDLDLYFTPSRLQPGEVALPRGLFIDPMSRIGTRNYTTSDPMSKVNWKASAAHGSLLVNVEEFSQNFSFNIIINMQARVRDSAPGKPSVERYIENNITVAASIIDRISAFDVSAAFISNTSCEDFGHAVHADEEFGMLRMTETFSERDILAALHTLAAVTCDISMTNENMMEVILSDPYFYAPSGNLIFVTAFFTESMSAFYIEMKKLGVTVSFYLTAGTVSVGDLPYGIEIFYVYPEKQEKNFALATDDIFVEHAENSEKSETSEVSE